MATIVSDGHIKLDVVQTGNNSSYVSLSITLQSTSRIFNIVGTVRLAGKTWSVSTEGAYGPGTILLTGSHNVPYDGDSTVTSTVSFTGQYYYYDEDDTPVMVDYWNNPLLDYYTATRPVTAAISVSSGTVDLGTAVSIYTSGGSSTSAITWKVGSHSGTVKNNVGNTTTTWTPPLDDGTKFARYITNSKTATCTLTWNGVSTNITLRVPSGLSTLPAVGISVSPYNNTDLNGRYVFGKSQASFTINAVAKLGATIKTYSVSFNGETFTTATGHTGVLTELNPSCSVTVTDSRGFTNSASYSFAVDAYNSPTLENVQIYRADSNGNADDEGQYIKFLFTPTITAVADNNAKRYRLQYKRSTQSSWTNVPSGDLGVLDSYTAQHIELVNANASIQYLYDARVAITDSFETVYSNIFSLPTADVIMDFNSAGTGGGVGMYTQGADMFDIAWQLVPHKGIRPRGQTNEKGKLIPVKTIEIDNSTSFDNIGSEWLKQVCTLWPGIQESIFIGTARFTSGSRGFLIAFIYDTSTIDSTTGLPQHSFGTQWWFGSSAALNYRHFGTSSYNYFSAGV